MFAPLGLATAFVLVGVSGSYLNPHRTPPAKIPTDAGPEEWAAYMDRWGPRPPWQVYRSPHRTVECLRWDGTVVDVSDRFIEVLRNVDEKPTKYPAHFLLATGRVLAWENDPKCYLLEDVKVGDEVVVAVGTEDEKRGEECFYVSIRRRTGGKIPPSRNPSEVHPYHIEQQAKYDLLEKGTPLPEHMRNERIPPLKPVAPPKAASSQVTDPPVAKPPGGPTEKAKDEGKKDERRPTTKEEFEALAKQGPKPPWMPFIGERRVTVQAIDGTVVEISREVIEIQLKGKKETAKYPPHTLLDTGAVCHWETEANCYLLDDVQKGDIVVLTVGTVDKEKGPECFCVNIHERPGGVVPASRKPSYPKPYHVERQNEIDDARNAIPKKEKQPEMPPKKDEKK